MRRFAFKDWHIVWFRECLPSPLHFKSVKWLARLATFHQETSQPGGGGQPRYEIIHAPTNSSIEGVVGGAQNDWSFIMPTWIP